VIDEVCSDRTIGYEDYKTGHLYTQILDMVLEVANNESVKSSMLRYLKHQPFISLGKISLYAAQQNLPWLEESVKDQVCRDFKLSTWCEANIIHGEFLGINCSLLILLLQLYSHL